jgi:hypothetical protein
MFWYCISTDDVIFRGGDYSFGGELTSLEETGYGSSKIISGRIYCRGFELRGC